MGRFHRPMVALARDSEQGLRGADGSALVAEAREFELSARPMVECRHNRTLFETMFPTDLIVRQCFAIRLYDS
jgi:hypothetical protein